MNFSAYVAQVANSDVRFTGLLLVLVNLLPLGGVFFWDWDVGNIVMLYWAENLIIGFWVLVKILLAAPLGGLFLAAFFLIHYGGFCAGHGVLASQLLGLPIEDPMGELSWPFFFVFVEMLYNITVAVFSAASTPWLWCFYAVAFSHTISFVYHRLLRREDVDKQPRELMSQPYGRIIVMHLTVLLGAFAIEALGAPIALLAILVATKTVIDLNAHRKAHAKAEVQE